MNSYDIVEAFSLEEAMTVCGIPFPPTPLKNISNIHFTRWGKNYKYYAKRLGHCYIIGDYSRGLMKFWFPKSYEYIDPCLVHNRSKRSLSQKRYRDQQKLYEKTALEVQNIYNQAFWLTSHHPYLQNKGITPDHIKVDRHQRLLIPAYDENDKLWTMQMIDMLGNKRFYPRGRKKGCFHRLNRYSESNQFFLVEGYATGVSLAEALPEHHVAVCFDAGNLEHVLKALKKRYPKHEYIIAADNDHSKDRNTGVEIACTLVRKYQCQLIVPKFSDKILEAKPDASDWNDIHLWSGIADIRSQICGQF